MKKNCTKLIYNIFLLTVKGFILQCLFVTIVAAGTTGASSAQSVYEVNIDLELKNATLKAAITKISEKTDYTFAFNITEMKRKRNRITKKFYNESVGNILEFLAQSYHLDFKRINETIHVKESHQLERKQTPVDERFVSLKQISGKVTDENGQGLPGASIIEKGTTNGTTADSEGKYRLTVSEGAILTFSFIGYQAQEIPVNNRSVIDVQMVADISELEEIVVVGYGTTRRSDLTGSVASVTTTELAEQPNNNILTALQGRAAGVQVFAGDNSPGGGINIRIRGTSTITGSTEPLYIIDGFPVTSDNASLNIGGGRGEGATSEGPGTNVFPNALSMINPSDIANIEILKDAAATAIYGSRGANGVVIITTKRGSIGKAKVSVDYSVSVSTLGNKLERLEGNLQGQISNERAIEDGADPADVRWNGADEFHPIPDGTAPSFDWQDVVYREALTHNLAITFSGGNEKTKYLISGNVLDQEGIMRETDFKDYRFRINLDNEINSFLSFKSSVLLSTSERRAPPGGGSGFGYNVVTRILSFHPLINPEWRDPDNPNLWYVDPEFGGDISQIYSNPLKMLQDIEDLYKRNRLLGNISATVNIIDNLKLVGNAGIDYIDGQRTIFERNTLILAGQENRGRGILRTNESIRTNFNAYLSWDKSFGDHTFNALLGAENTTTRRTTVNLQAAEFAVDDLLTDDFQVANSESFNIDNSTDPNFVLIGFFGRANYNFKNKYYVSLNARRDGSSVFGPNNKWGFFPSAALAWRITEESFLQGQDILSDLKIRTSIGQTGNGNLATGSSEGVWSLSNNRYSFGGSAVLGASLSRISNPELKWESTTQYNIGFDARLMEGRFGVVFDFYIKDTEDLILPVVIPPTSGFSSSIQNLGTLRNRGIEIAVDAVILDKGDFKWSVNGNISFQKMFATDVQEGTNEDPRTGERYLEVFNFPRRNGPRLYEGEDAGQMYAYVRGGVFATQEEADAAPKQIEGNVEGYAWYRDIDGNGEIDFADQVAVGKITPDFIYGFSTNLSYKNFDLSLFFQGVEGNSIVSWYRGDIEDPRNINFWTEENRNTNVPVNAIPNGELGGGELDSEDVQDGSYLRLKNVRLGYRVPGDVKYFGGLNVFFTGTNLLTFTDYDGYDPDVSAGGSTPFSEGYDTGVYPYAKQFTLGFNYNF
ncbi:SusC/RagA family TonB-linked outer membrane protein [Fulvivirgaceae bacterium BMA12]|uniref:SusC/RagA family TonB-linked outer membrane protein n=1 Tax=Agaribacillus aureus TaxID=3051825 RepID=A0ABT8LB71_9BACT|nr:SusC/RagA family TonB-linked outer membrane protein [Fulvivirgaceae bacterium BMA12]